jgi:hypothetical protein
MQFDRDVNSELSELYLDVRAYIMQCIDTDENNIIENFTDNLTSYFHKEYHSGFCYIRVKDDFVHIGWFRGASMIDIPNQFFGNGKCLRGQKIKKLDTKTKKAIKYYVEETKGILIELAEKKKFK